MKTLLSLATAIAISALMPALANTGVAPSAQIGMPLVPSIEKLQASTNSDSYDVAAMRCAHWLLEAPQDENTEDLRDEASRFLVAWMDLTDHISLSLGNEIYPLMENREVLVAYLAAAAIYAMDAQSPVYSSSMQYHSLWAAINYYQSNRDRIGSLDGLELLTKLRNEGRLDYYLTTIAPMLATPVAYTEE